jgi:hypothetical protein
MPHGPIDSFGGAAQKMRAASAPIAASDVAGRELADLDAAPLGRRALGRDREGLVLARGVEQEEAADHFLRLGERAVDDVLRPSRFCSRRAPEPSDSLARSTPRVFSLSAKCSICS